MYLVLMGVIGILIMMLAPMLIVYFLKHKEYETAFIIAIAGLPIGFGLLVGWLWG